MLLGFNTKKINIKMNNQTYKPKLGDLVIVRDADNQDWIEKKIYSYYKGRK